MKNPGWKKMTCAVLAAGMLLSSVTPAFAKGRTDAEWAMLRDNILSYNEIDGLINEYNPAVQKNRYELEDYEKHFGSSNASLRRAYEDLAMEAYASMSLGSETDPTYGIDYAKMLAAEAKAQEYEANADKLTDDYETYRLSYEQAEKTLAQSTKEALVKYFSTELSRQQAELNAALLDSSLSVKNLQLSLGMTTNADVLTAQESLLNARKAVNDANAQLPLLKKKLQVACGWKYEDDPVLEALPEPDLARINTMNPTADLPAALANNYTLRINQRKLANSNGDSSIDTLKTTIRTNEQNISTSLNAAYANVLAARDAYQYAVTNQALQNTNLNVMQNKYAKGGASSIELKTQETQTKIAQLQALQAKYEVLSAITAYDYAVNGLAGA